jgi:hypothetical protein
MGKALIFRPWGFYGFEQKLANTSPVTAIL